jgi:hypothetical protein
VSLICCSCMERGKACPDTAGKLGASERERSKRLNRKGLSTVAGRVGGPVCSSEEAPVTGVERRDWVIRGWCSFGQPGRCPGGAG